MKRIDNLEHLSDFQPGQVLVADTTTPDWEPVMKIAAAIVTNRGGRTCHAAIIARELGIRRTVRLLISHLVEVPAVIGWLRPAILFPVDFLAGLPAGYVSALLTYDGKLVGRIGVCNHRPFRAGQGGDVAYFNYFETIDDEEVAGGLLDAADVIVTPGAQGALTAAFRALIPAGGVLLVESPTYPGALAVAAAAGIRTVPVPVDGDGIRPDALAQAFAATGARAVYCQPAFQNPTGAVLSAPRRAQVLDTAAAAGAFVVEDDYGRWLAHERPAPPPLITQDGDGRVVHLT